MRKILSLIMIMLMIFGAMPMSFAEQDNTNATIIIAGDDRYDLYVNGALIASPSSPTYTEGQSTAAGSPFRVKIEDGKYTVAIKGQDTAWHIAGVGVVILFDDGTVVNAGTNWKHFVPSEGNPVPGDWFTTSFIDNTWADAYQIPNERRDGNWKKTYSVDDVTHDLPWMWSQKFKQSDGAFDTEVYFRYNGFKSFVQLRPIFEGWVNNGDGTYKAYFGYLNESMDNTNSPMAVNIPFGTDSNKVSGFTGDTVFPSDFAIGRTPFYPNAAIVVDGWDGNNIVWTLDGRTATANVNNVGQEFTTESEDEDPANNDPSNTNPSNEDPEPQQPTPTEPAGPQSSVTINYVDSEGNSLLPSFVFSGTVGTNYVTTARTIEGFELVETPSNASGSFVEGGVVVDYVYSDGTEEIVVEETPLGEATTEAEPVVEEPTEEVTTEAVEEVVLDEATPLAEALPQTGQATPELFFGLGGLISAAGLLLKRKNK